MDFLDIASRYAQNRFDNAMPDLSNGFETEEERRKRMERERAEAEKQRALIGNTEVQSQQVKTYADGSQEHITTQQMPGPVAPATPAPPKMTPAFNYPQVQPPSNPMFGVDPANSGIYTDMTPGARVGMNNEEIVGPNGQTYNYNALKEASEQRMADSRPPLPTTPLPVNNVNTTPQAAPVAQPPAQPVAPAMAAPGRLSPEHQAAIDKVLPPAASAMAPPAPAVPPQGAIPAPVAPVNPNAPPAAPAMAPTPTQAPAPITTTPENWQDRITTAKTAKDYRQIMSDPNTPEEIAQVAAGRYADSLNSSKEEKKAEQTVMAAAQGDPKAANDLTRALKKNTEEGSYIKAVLFARLGLNDLAKEEQQKLGAGSQFQSVIGPDGSRYTAEVNGQGGFNNVYDTSGKAVGADVIAQLSAQGITSKGATVHTGMLRDRTTGEIYYQRVQGGQAQLVSPKGQVFSGDTKNLYAYGIGSDLETKNAIQLQTLRNDLLNKPKIEAAKDLAKFNAMNGTNYSVDQVINSAPALQVGAPGEAPSAGAPAQTSTGQPVDSGAAIKNNNPGNIRYGTVAKDMGATGRAPNGMAIFPDLSTGTSAQEKLLSSPAYKNLTLGQAIAKWAPNNENNPAEYLRYMKRETGLDMDKEFKDLNANDKQTFLSAQARFEHGLPSTAGKGGVNAPPTAMAATPTLPPQPQPGEAPNIYAGRMEAWKKENDKITGSQLSKVQNAKEVYDVFKEINQALPKATGSGLGEQVDNIYRFFGSTNEGMKATAQLRVLGDRLLKAVPRFEGPQSDRDVQSYKDAAADLAAANKTNEERMAAFKTILDLNKKYLPGVDWEMKNESKSGIKIIKREKIS